MFLEGHYFAYQMHLSREKGCLLSSFSKGNLRTTGFDAKKFLEALTRFHPTNVNDLLCAPG